MPQVSIPLTSLSMTSSSVDTSTQATPYVDISDARAISGFINGATTAPGFIAQVSYDGISTAPTFVNLTWASSGGSVVYLTSAGFTIPMIVAQRLRIATSNVTSTSATVVWNKQVLL